MFHSLVKFSWFLWPHISQLRSLHTKYIGSSTSPIFMFSFTGLKPHFSTIVIHNHCIFFLTKRSTHATSPWLVERKLTECQWGLHDVHQASPYTCGQFLHRPQYLRKDNFLEGPLRKELVMLQGAYLSYTGSQWSNRSWSKHFFHNVLGIVNCKWLCWNTWIHICQIEGKTGKEYHYILGKVAEMIFVDVAKLLSQHPLLLWQDCCLKPGEGMSVDPQLWLVQMSPELSALDMWGKEKHMTWLLLQGRTGRSLFTSKFYDKDTQITWKYI